jgi:hypothetical protein
MRRAYEMFTPAVVHRATREEVVATRRWELPRMDRENWELEEAVSAVFAAEAMVARDIARYQADQEAVKAAEAA